jgi:phosphate transport system permease protein
VSSNPPQLGLKPPAPPSPGPGGAIRGTRAKPTRERVIEVALLACASLSVLTTVGIVGVLIVETVAFFREVGVGAFLLDTVWTPLFADAHFGIWPLIAGTALTSGIAISVALPMGLLAAVYLSEFASPRARRILKPTLELLAGIPTIVYGYFALIFATPLLQSLVPDLAAFNALSPGIVMGIMIIPMVSSLSEDAIYAVPNGLREASYALGASKLPTIFRVVLPSAFSGIAASLIVAIAAGQEPRLTADPRVPVQTMTAYIVQVTMGDTPTGTIAYKTVFAVGFTLFCFTLFFNLVAQRFARRFRQGRE